MRVLVVGEGKHEELALPVLVKRLNHRVADYDFRVVRNGRKIHGKGAGHFKRAVGWLLTAESEGFDALIFLIDEDGDASRSRQLTDAQEYTGVFVPRACGMAIRTFDAWFLADEQALSGVLGLTVQRQPNPERETDPKSRCRTLAGSDGTSLASVFAEAAKTLDLTVLRSRCPRGFGPFADCVKAMAPEAG